MNQIAFVVNRIISRISFNFGLYFPKEPVFAWNALPLQNNPNLNEPNNGSNDAKSILDEIFGSFLFAVPKKRRPIEVRLKRKHGAENWGPEARKLLRTKQNIIVCNECGHFHESKYICSSCYAKVKDESAVIQKAILDEFKLDAVEQEVLVRYDNDNKEEVGNKRLVEIPKKRPPFFSNNLLSRALSAPRTASVTQAEKQPKFK